MIVWSTKWKGGSDTKYIKRENWISEVYLYTENRYSNENMLIIICNNVAESRIYYIEWKKPTMKDYRVYDSII